MALSWTATALCADIASHRIGAQPLNLIRMGLSLFLLALFLLVVTGSPAPVGADPKTWFWLALSGLVGYVFGDFCLFNSYVIFGPFIGVSLSLMAVEYAQAGIASTLMALTPVLIIVPYSLIYKQRIKLQEVLGTLVTITGVAMFFLL